MSFIEELKQAYDVSHAKTILLDKLSDDAVNRIKEDCMEAAQLGSKEASRTVFTFGGSAGGNNHLKKEVADLTKEKLKLLGFKEVNLSTEGWRIVFF